MNEEKEDVADPASEVTAEHVAEDQDVSEKPARQVPLEALEAERRKRQEYETRIRVYEEMMQRQKSQPEPEPDEDLEELVSKGDLKKFEKHLTSEQFFVLKREIAEETFKETRPDAIKEINAHLKEILERKPWLAETIEKATNRYARAFEIVQDYKPQVSARKEVTRTVDKMVENSKKPGSPASMGKSQQLSGADYLKSIAGTSEFKEYRKKLLGR